MSVSFQPTVSGPLTALASSVSYQPFGPLAGFNYGNGLVRSHGFDLDYQLTNITTLSSTANVQNLVLTYDAAFDIKTIADKITSPFSQTFAYDQKYRLTNATGIYGTLKYTYDPDDNRLTKSLSGVTETNKYPTTQNRLTSTIKSGVTRSFTYAANGNVITDNRGTATNLIFGYGDRNRYRSLTNGNILIATYKYSALGERLIKTVGNATTHFHYDEGGHLIAETQPDGTLIREYVWLNDMPLAQIESNGAIYYIHPDHLNRPQKMTDVNQAIVWDNEQQPFGEVIPPTLAPIGYDSSKQFQMAVSGALNNTYIVQASANLGASNWVSLATNAGPSTFTDPTAPNYQTRFYRVIRYIASPNVPSRLLKNSQNI
jgi:hypothetical protein